MASLLQFLIRSYRYLVSPWLGSNCRYYPSCSEYAAQAVARYGAAKGCWLVTKRVCRCHPWHEGGFDPVP